MALPERQLCLACQLRLLNSKVRAHRAIPPIFSPHRRGPGDAAAEAAASGDAAGPRHWLRPHRLQLPRRRPAGAAGAAAAGWACLLFLRHMDRCALASGSCTRLHYVLAPHHAPSLPTHSAQEEVQARGYRVLTPLVSLDTPGKATVQVVILADPDGHEVRTGVGGTLLVACCHVRCSPRSCLLPAQALLAAFVVPCPSPCFHAATPLASPRYALSATSPSASSACRMTMHPRCCSAPSA